MTQKTRPLSHRIQKRTGHKQTWADKHYETFSHKILDSRVPLCYAISEGRPPLCNTSPPESTNVHLSPPMSVRVRHCPFKSANVRPSPPMSVHVRECPSKSANVRQCPLMSQKTRPLSHRIQKGQDIDGRDTPPLVYNCGPGICAAWVPSNIWSMTYASIITLHCLISKTAVFLSRVRCNIFYLP